MGLLNVPYSTGFHDQIASPLCCSPLPMTKSTCQILKRGAHSRKLRRVGVILHFSEKAATKSILQASSWSILKCCFLLHLDPTFPIESMWRNWMKTLLL
jgi:hypothetical protein